MSVHGGCLSDDDTVTLEGQCDERRIISARYIRACARARARPPENVFTVGPFSHAGVIARDA